MKYFKLSEFDSPDVEGSGIQMNEAFLNKLDFLREILDEPIIIISGFRTEIHNKVIEGRENSAHLRGCAADIFCENSRYRYKLLRAIYQLDFKRIEICPMHIHIDTDESLPQEVLFLK